MVDAEHDEVHAVRGRLAVLARAARSGKLVRANNVLGTEVARAQAVGAANKCAALRPWPVTGQTFRRRVAFILNRLRQRGANVAAQRIVAGQRFVGPLQDDDVLLALERGHNRRLREGPNHVHVDRADRHAARLRAGNRPRLRCSPPPNQARQTRCRRRRSCTSVISP